MNLPNSLISRFDLIFLVLDRADMDVSSSSSFSIYYYVYGWIDGWLEEECGRRIGFICCGIE